MEKLFITKEEFNEMNNEEKAEQLHKSLVDIVKNFSLKKDYIRFSNSFLWEVKDFVQEAACAPESVGMNAAEYDNMYVEFENLCYEEFSSFLNESDVKEDIKEYFVEVLEERQDEDSWHVENDDLLEKLNYKMYNVHDYVICRDSAFEDVKFNGKTVGGWVYCDFVDNDKIFDVIDEMNSYTIQAFEKLVDYFTCNNNIDILEKFTTSNIKDFERRISLCLAEKD